MIKADTPNLWEIRQNLGVVKTNALIVYALACVAELVNIERNLSEPQMMELAEDILTDYGYFKLEEIKYILKRAVKSEKLFARLDYNIVMGWFKAYDAERTEHCMDISDQAETEVTNRVSAPEDEDAIPWEEYVAMLRDRAGQGDTEAANRLSDIEQFSSINQNSTANEKDRKTAFKTWLYREYLPGRKR